MCLNTQLFIFTLTEKSNNTDYGVRVSTTKEMVVGTRHDQTSRNKGTFLTKSDPRVFTKVI